MSSLTEQNRYLSNTAAAHESLKRDHVELQTQHENLQRDLGSERSVIQVEPTSTRSPSSDSLDAIRSAHSLEISQHAERIRTLEESLHASTSRVHSLSRQLTDLHTAYATAQKERDDLTSSANFSPAAGSSTRGLFISPVEESPQIRQARYSPSLAQRSLGVDALLPASVRHKRQVSLTALKARMGTSYTRPPLSPMRLDNVTEGSSTTSSDNNTPGLNALGLGKVGVGIRKQFGDEIVFCCPACEGDLITL